MVKQIAIIGASYLQVPLIKKVKELGYISHVFAWKCGDVGEKIADFFYPISIVEKDLILEKCKEINIDGICSIASDLAVITVNYVAEKLSLNGNTISATEISTNKYMMRNAFEENGDPSPKSYLLDDTTDIDELILEYPVIVKPTDRSGSRGIYKLDNPDMLKIAVKKAMAESFEKKALVEEYVSGQEYSVEYISYKGKHHFLALTQKYTTGAPQFIETAHLEPASVDETALKSIKSVVEHALDTLQIKNSASHSEIKIDKYGSIKIIEIGGRMGGDCIGSDLVYYSTGIDFVRAVIQVACDEEPDLSCTRNPEPVKSVFILNKEDYEEYERLKSSAPNMILREAFLDIELLDKATDSSNRAGCYIMKAVDVCEKDADKWRK